MSRTSTAAKTARQTPPELCPCIKVGDLEPSTLGQPRRQFNQQTLDELAADIKVRGVLEPLLVRVNGRNKHEIICGERRWRAAKIAGLIDVPVRVVSMDDQQAREAQIAENLHREDIHPLDEAAAYRQLLDLSVTHTTAELARQVNKPETYVTRRLSLNNLVDEAKKDYGDGHLTLGHALELSRLSPAAQAAALVKGCYEWRWASANKTIAIKDQPKTVGHLKDWINRTQVLDLSAAPWKLDDETLVPAQGPCTTCVYRTGTNPMLFPEASKSNLCTNPAGYKAKQDAWLERRRYELLAESGQKTEYPLYISSHSYPQDVPKETLAQGSFYPVTRKQKCEYARAALLVDGPEFGQTRLVCVHTKCKDHAGKKGGPSAAAASGMGRGSGPKKSPEEFRARKQELFDIRVAEETRIQIFKDALPKLPKVTIAPPLRKWLNQVALMLMLRTPSNTLNAVNKVWFGDAQGDGNGKAWVGLSYDSKNDGNQIVALNTHDLIRLMALLSFAHFGENEHMAQPRSQKDVVELAAGLKLNYKLRDAEVRCMLAPKRAQVVHQEYLDQVKAGKNPKVPSVNKPEEPSTKKPAAKKAATKKKGRK